jgi:hypothetical protein
MPRSPAAQRQCRLMTGLHRGKGTVHFDEVLIEEASHDGGVAPIMPNDGGNDG